MKPQPPVPDDGRTYHPLGLAQRPIWLDVRLSGANGYRLGGWARIPGRMDTQELRTSVAMLMERHDALRLRVDAQTMRQWIATACEPPLHIRAAMSRPLCLDAELARIFAAPLPFGDAALFRIDAIEAEEHTLLVWCFHHIIADAMSVGIVLSHWLDAWRTLRAGGSVEQLARSSILPTLAADSAYDGSPAYQRDLAYWVRRFDARPAPLIEAAGRPGGAGVLSSVAGAVVAGAVHEGLVKAAAGVGLTPVRALLGLAAIGLARRHGRSEIVCGLALHRRDRSNAQAIGMMAGVIPVLTRFETWWSLADCLQAFSEQVDADLRHGRLPIDALRRALKPSDAGSGALFDLAMSYVPASPPADVQGVEAGLVDAREATPITLHATDDTTTGGLAFRFVVSPDHMDVIDAQALCDALLELIAQFGAGEEIAFDTLLSLPVVERSRVDGFSRGVEVSRAGWRLEAGFAGRALASPGAVAVVGVDGGVSSYGGVLWRAGALAGALSARGVGPGSVVGVQMARSADLVVALLGVLRSGAAWLPLDPDLPVARRAYMVEDAGAALVLGDGTAGVAVEALADLGVPDAAAAEAASGAASPEMLAAAWAGAGAPPAQDDAAAAYVIYTSGTTGRPKGVVVPHRAAANLVLARNLGPLPAPVGPGDRVLASSSIGFDVSVGQLVLPLAMGATVVMAPSLGGLAPAEFWALLRARGVTYMASVPSVLSAFLAAAPGPGLSLRTLNLGGEPMSGAFAARIAAALPGVCLVNAYGPTEACIEATYHVVVADDHARASVPIGRPLANLRARVLDAGGAPVGIGVVGELYLGGPCLALGYLGQPELTAERFIEDPCDATPGARLYRTGDLARWRSDGSLDFLGRRDEQVKIRGQRIEPGELAATVQRQPGIAAAAAAARGRAGAQRLVAYIVPEQGRAIDIAALRRALAAELPEVMLPAAILTLDALPLTPNGKLDTAALPEPEASAQGEPPEGEAETTLAAIWAELLDTPIGEIRRDTSFFDIGGHSLSAVALVERLRGAGYGVDVRALFERPQLAALAAALEPAGAAAAAVPCLVPEDARAIVPEMLPLARLSQAEIDAVLAQVGGAAAVADIYPLTPLQGGILLQHLASGRSAAGEDVGAGDDAPGAAAGDPYLTPALLAFDRPERRAAFLDALERLVARHDALRTAVVWRDLRAPVQVVLRRVALPIHEISVPAGQDAEAALRALHDPRRFRMDLSQAPLLDIALAEDPARAGRPARWLLSLVTHHLILDHASLEVLLAEGRRLSEEPGAALPPAPPYRQHVAATLAANDGPALAASRAFFGELLGDLDTPCLPFGLADTALAAGATHAARHRLPGALAARLRAAAGGARITPASLFHLAWAARLARAAGQREAVFGTVLMGRMAGHAGALAGVGMFINTLPVRIGFAGSLAGRLAATQAQLAQLLRFEHTPLALAQRMSAVPAPTPLFSALFNYRHALARDAAPWAGVEMLSAEERTTYPLALAVDDLGAPEGFALTLHAAQGLDPAGLLAELEAIIATLVAGLETAPDQPADTLLSLPVVERSRVEGFSRGVDVSRAGWRLEAGFAARALASPGAAAVLGVDGAVASYGGVLWRAVALAGALSARGVGPGSVVGVQMARSADLVVALLGVLRAGAAWLPLDPDLPAARRAYIVEDAGAALVLGDGTAGVAVEALADLGVPDAAAAEAASGAASPEMLAAAWAGAGAPPAQDDAAAAYVIYTSGTTGRPKGVVVPHRAAANLVLARNLGPLPAPVGPGDRVLASSSIGFDVSVGQLVLPLAMGATVVMAPSLGGLAPAEFWALLRARGVTYMASVPSVLSAFLAAAPGPGLSLRTLNLGGEPMSGAFAARIAAALPGVCLVNAYGPTEACIEATYHVVVADDHARASVPIGRPLANLRARVLDAGGAPVGIGVVGELYLGGPCLALGYLGQPELTAERFIEDPCDATPGARLYRTGDLARWRSDGSLDFLGRRDEQVKIRGQRIEPGELAATVQRQPGIAAAAAAARGRAGAQRLVAYIVPEQGRAIDIAALRRALAAELPEVMLPAAILTLDALPLTPNGKLDTAALPEPEASAQGEPPEGEAETTLAAIWSELLDTPIAEIRRDTSFFDIGGHSLSAVALVERLRGAGYGVDVRALFERPQLAAIAAALEPAGAQAAAVPCLVPEGAGAIVPEMLPLARLSQAEIDAVLAQVGGAAAVADIYPLTPLQGGILLQHLASGRGAAGEGGDGAAAGDPYLTPALLAFDRPERRAAFLDALERLVARHDALRTAVVWRDLRAPVQVVLRRVALPIHEISVPAGQDAEAALRALHDPRRFRMDLSQAPLLDIALAEDPARAGRPARWLLSLVTHHLILDHASLEVLLAEGRRLSEEPGAALPPAPPYRQHVAATLAANEGPALAASRAFFGEMLGDLDTPCLPFGLADTALAAGATRAARHRLPGALAARLRAAAGGARITPASLFHLAWAARLARAAGQREAVFGTVLMGRMAGHAGALAGVGMFINTLPVRIGFAGSLAGRLAATQAQLAQLLRFEHTPLALAQRMSAVPAPTPLFSALFNYRHALARDAAPWAGVEMLSAEERTTYPLALAVDDLGAPEGFALTLHAAQGLDPAGLLAELEAIIATLVAGLETAPDQPADTLLSLPGVERSRVEGFSRGVDVSRAGWRLEAGFAARALASPGAAAVLGVDGAVASYGGVLWRAVALAGALSARGVGPGRWWACRWRARRIWWLRCWVCCGRVRRGCRSTLICRRRVGPTWWRMPGLRWCWAMARRGWRWRRWLILACPMRRRRRRRRERPHRRCWRRPGRVRVRRPRRMTRRRPM